jgi:aryl-phospho-beta-D-glucosidase BglC (GH1 family)
MQHKKMKKVVATVISVACMMPFATLLPTSAATVLDANEITQEMGLGFNIGNALDSSGFSTTSSYQSGSYDITDFEKYWGNPAITKQLVDTIKAKGFQTVRIPTTWYEHITETKDSAGNPVYTIDEAWLARVKEVVDYAYEDGMYVILNIHHEEWINRSDFATAYDEMSPELIQVWTQIATYFADYDQHLIFEGMNEPREIGSSLEWTGDTACYEVVNKLNQDFVSTVRSIDSPYKDTRLLMIPSYVASAYSSIYCYLDLPEDDYVAVSVHAYCPYNFAMGDNSEPYSYDHTQFTSSYESELDSVFKDLQSYFTDNDIPVVIGEFSASNYNNTEARVDWATYYLTWAKKLGIPCVLWDNNTITNSTQSERHGYLNRSTLQWYDVSEPVVDAMLSVLSDDSIAWGSEQHLPTYEHSDFSSGTILFEDTSGKAFGEGGIADAVAIDGAQLNENTELAVKYTSGTRPVIAFMDASWGNWTEVSPYDVDEENGIAYYKYEDIAKAWSGSVSDIKSGCVRADSSSVLYGIAILPAATISTTPTTPTTPDPVETVIRGDVSGDEKVNVIDLTLMKRSLINTKELSQTELTAHDWNEDGTFNLQDVVGLTKFLLQKN